MPLIVLAAHAVLLGPRRANDAALKADFSPTPGAREECLPRVPVRYRARARAAGRSRISKMDQLRRCAAPHQGARGVASPKAEAKPAGTQHCGRAKLDRQPVRAITQGDRLSVVGYANNARTRKRQATLA